MTFSLSNEGIKLLQSFEGFCSKPYRCLGGYWTVGYGHVLKREEEDLYEKEINEETAYRLLEKDLYQIEKSLSRLIDVTLRQNQIDALGSFTFNVGSGALQRSCVRRLVNREEHDQVPQELLKWIWAGGRKHKGLLYRRQKEGELYESA